MMLSVPATAIAITYMHLGPAMWLCVQALAVSTTPNPDNHSAAAVIQTEHRLHNNATAAKDTPSN
jgi:hypothetical protein